MRRLAYCAELAVEAPTVVLNVLEVSAIPTAGVVVETDTLISSGMVRVVTIDAELLEHDRLGLPPRL